MTRTFIQTRPLIDRLIGVIDARFSPDVVAYYLTGSHADGSANPSSDVDVFVVLAGAASSSPPP